MESYWQKTADLPQFPKAEGDLRTDVLVIGGGFAGLLTAYLLQQKGVRVTVLEKGRVFSGVSEKTTAKITVQHGLIYHKIEKQYSLEAAQKSGVVQRKQQRVRQDSERIPGGTGASSRQRLCGYDHTGEGQYLLQRLLAHACRKGTISAGVRL